MAYGRTDNAQRETHRKYSLRGEQVNQNTDSLIVQWFLNLLIPWYSRIGPMNTVLSALRQIVRRGHWKGEGGYREVLAISVPLILSTSAWSLQMFVDRTFLSWYSPEALAASLPAGILNITTTSIFAGTAGYVSVFVSQYYGAGRFSRMGSAMWQGIYIALIGGFIHLLLIPFAPQIFALFGHEPAVQRFESEYFQMLCLGAAPHIASAAFSGYFTGIGRTWPVMWINFVATGFNLTLDYVLIFGKFGFPEMGMKGAGIATSAAAVVYCILYVGLFYIPGFAENDNALRQWRLDLELFKRLIRFGLPSGMQFFIDLAGFTGFILIVGHLGTEDLAATNVAFNVNTIAFMPMMGLGFAISILVGKYLGAEKPPLAESSSIAGFHLSFAYMSFMGLCYIALPSLFLLPFELGADPERFAPVAEKAKILLRFLALFALFDGMNIIFSSALKGAGDTRFVMFMLTTMAIFGLVLPVGMAVYYFQANIYTVWTIATVYGLVLALGFFVRFSLGHWKEMRVIEEAPPLD